jgi:hypothetical protein
MADARLSSQWYFAINALPKGLRKHRGKATVVCGQEREDWQDERETLPCLWILAAITTPTTAQPRIPTVGLAGTSEALPDFFPDAGIPVLAGR